MSKVKPEFTVAELIAKLETFPKDALIVCQRYSSVVEMELPTMKSVIKNRGGWYDEYRPTEWKKHEEVAPRVITVCFFEGN